MHRSEQGFTFVEMLLVLMMTLIVASIALIYGTKGIQEKETRFFFEQLVSDAVYIQQYAKNHHVKMDLIFDERTHLYSAKKRETNKKIFVRTMPSSMKIKRGSTLYKIGFNENGNASYVGRLTFLYFGGEQDVYVYLGSGRITVK